MTSHGAPMSQTVDKGNSIEARLIQGGSDAVFEGPKPEAMGCPTIPGMKPKLLRDQEAETFLRETLPGRCSKKAEAIVVLGNDDGDIKWILTHLTQDQKPEDINWLTVYNPMHESDIKESEDNLRKYLTDNTGCLVTLGSKFDGMESAVVVLVYSNPYSSNFRANYMRASVELILIDRHNMGTASLAIVSLARQALLSKGLICHASLKPSIIVFISVRCKN